MHVKVVSVQGGFHACIEPEAGAYTCMHACLKHTITLRKWDKGGKR